MTDLASDHAPYDGILLDIGVSSPQLDHPERGFSFRTDGPLDMRMDPTTGESAAELLDRLDIDALTTILRDYGEEPRAKRIARAILAGRPWKGTSPSPTPWPSPPAIATAVPTLPPELFKHFESPSTTSSVASNVDSMQLSPCWLQRVACKVISFHSLEDRIVKQRFRTLLPWALPATNTATPASPHKFAWSPASPSVATGSIRPTPAPAPPASALWNASAESCLPPIPSDPSPRPEDIAMSNHPTSSPPRRGDTGVARPTRCICKCCGRTLRFAFSGGMSRSPHRWRPARCCLPGPASTSSRQRLPLTRRATSLPKPLQSRSDFSRSSPPLLTPHHLRTASTALAFEGAVHVVDVP